MGSVEGYTRRVKRWRGGQMIQRWVCERAGEGGAAVPAGAGYRDLRQLVGALDALAPPDPRWPRPTVRLPTWRRIDDLGAEHRESAPREAQQRTEDSGTRGRSRVMRIDAGRLRLCRLILATMLAGQAWSVTGADAQEVGAPIRAAHVDALRADVEAQAPDCSSVFRWTDDPIVPGVTQVKADHIVELRRAINDLAQGQCPTLQEQVTFESVGFTNSTSGNNYVAGFVLNSGSVSIAGRRGLYVRVRFFDDDGNVITEDVNYLRTDNRGTLTTLDVQIRRPFWVEFGDDFIKGWSYFQVVAFEAAGRSVLCSGCNQRHIRQREQVTFESVRFRDADDGYQYVEGFVLNSGSVSITGRGLYVRVRFYDGNGNPMTEGVNYLRTDNRGTLTTLDVQIRRPFSVWWQDSQAPQNWGYFQVVSFEDDGRRLPCVGCDQQHPR